MKRVTDDLRLWPEQLEGWSYINHYGEGNEEMYKGCVSLQNKAQSYSLDPATTLCYFIYSPRTSESFFVKLQRDPV